MIEQALAQMRKISIAVACRCNTLVRLDDLNSIPRQILVRQRAQHHPRCLPPAESSNELPAGGHGFPGFRRNDASRLAGGSIGVGKNFDLHDGIPIGAKPSWTLPLLTSEIPQRSLESPHQAGLLPCAALALRYRSMRVLVEVS